MISLFLFGTSRTLYIVGSRYSNEGTFLIILNLTATLLSLLILFILGETRINIGDLICGASLGALSVTGAISLYRANATSSPSLVNIILGLNFIIPLIIGLSIFREKLNIYQYAGLIIVILTIVLSIAEALKDSEQGLNMIGIIYSLITFFTWGFLGVLVKFFKIIGLLRNYPFCIFLMYLFEFILLVTYYHNRKMDKTVSIIGAAAGACSCVGSYLALICYAVGEISITSLILRFAFIIPTTYSMIILRDFNKLKIILLCLSILSVVLISI